MVTLGPALLVIGVGLILMFLVRVPSLWYRLKSLIKAELVEVIVLCGETVGPALMLRTSPLKLACRLIWAVLIPQSIPSIGEQTELIGTWLTLLPLRPPTRVGIQLWLCLIANLTLSLLLLVRAVTRRLGPVTAMLVGGATLLVMVLFPLSPCRHTIIGLLHLSASMTFPTPSRTLAMLLRMFGRAANLRRVLETCMEAMVVFGTESSSA